MTNTEIATLFSGGNFEEASDQIAETVEWFIYEEKMHLRGKEAVIRFCRSVTDYFRSLTTRFENYGTITGPDRVAIYGKAEFIHGNQTVNTIHSCDIYEFDGDGKVSRIYSYCNSAPVN